MHNRFIIPVIAATAFHALVFFGFNGSDTPPPIQGNERPEKPLPEIPQLTEIELEDPADPQDRAEAKSQRKGAEDVFMPQQEELPVRIDGLVFTPDPIRPPSDVKIDRVDMRLPGSAEGEGEEWTNRPVVSFKFLDNPPQTRVRVAPVYPAAARAAGISGEVLVEFVVDEQGRVLHARVVKSTNRMFDAPTLKAVEHWRFEPGKKTGQPVRFRMAAPVVFNLEV